MNFSKYIIFSLFAISLASCGGDFFETQVELPTPEHTPLLAVNCFIDAGDTLLIAKVNRTFGLFEETDSEESELVSGATVELYEGENLLYTLIEAPFSGLNPNYYFPASESFTEYGKTYELRVSHPDFADIKAKQTLPQPVPLTATEYRETEENAFSGAGGQLKLTFDDPAGEKNYYELFASRFVSFSCLDEEGNEIYGFEDDTGIFFETEGPDNPNVEYNFNYNSILLKDDAFDGQTYTFNADFYENKFFVDDPSCAESIFEEGKIQVYWRTVTEEYYRYTVSLRQNQEAGDNPFTEPVSVFSNFENGVGAFCLRSELIYEVE